MADANSTLTCHECGKAFQRKIAHGTEPKYCGSRCRNRVTQRAYRSRSNERATCSIEGCSAPSRTKKLCSKHYARLRAHGDPHHTTRGLRQTKACAWCDQEMRLKPAQANKTECCSKTCSNLLRAKREGKTIRPTGFWCAGCYKLAERSVRSSKDSGRYCNRACAEAHAFKVRRESAALRRIARNVRSAKERRASLIVLPEIQALRKIRQAISARLNECRGCGKSHIRRVKRNSFCSLQCETEHKLRMSKKHRRIAKAKRRALERSPLADNIDPVAVFNRDRWRCHLCGQRTLKSKRGTTHDRAPELEHIIALGDGGTHTWGNVACACRKCNSVKGALSVGQIGLEIPI